MKTFQYIIFSLFVILLSGCSTLNISDASFQTVKSYKSFDIPREIKNLRLNVTYLDKEEVAQKCAAITGVKSHSFLGCARRIGVSDSVCYVYMLKPNDFNDHGFLAIVGHEILHCLGANHE